MTHAELSAYVDLLNQRTERLTAFRKAIASDAERCQDPEWVLRLIDRGLYAAWAESREIVYGRMEVSP